MKAAVIYGKGGVPQYVEYPTPEPKNEKELLVTVKAVAIKHFDKGQANGTHYTSQAKQQGGKVIGGDGICVLKDGTRVYAVGAGGMMAEQAVIQKGRFVPVPDELDDATAAALPNAVFGAAMALKFKAEIQPGDVVLINGATGFTGRIAVQIARYYGAGKIYVTGRNQKSLTELHALGADEAISVVSDDEQFKTKITRIHQTTPINVVIDYLWGHTAELILECLKGDGSFSSATRYVSVGSMTGDLIHIPAAVLRSTNIQLTGSGLGSWTKSQVAALFETILPEMFQLAAGGKLMADTVPVPVSDISNIWAMDVDPGKRLVITF